jgi:hypothetical protein
LDRNCSGGSVCCRLLSDHRFNVGRLNAVRNNHYDRNSAQKKI